MDKKYYGHVSLVVEQTKRDSCLRTIIIIIILITMCVTCVGEKTDTK